LYILKGPLFGGLFLADHNSFLSVHTWSFSIFQALTPFAEISILFLGPCFSLRLLIILQIFS